MRKFITALEISDYRFGCRSRGRGCQLDRDAGKDIGCFLSSSGCDFAGDGRGRRGSSRLLRESMRRAEQNGE
jgi:hypothetical protein